MTIYMQPPEFYRVDPDGKMEPLEPFDFNIEVEISTGEFIETPLATLTYPDIPKELYMPILNGKATLIKKAIEQMNILESLKPFPVLFKAASDAIEQENKKVKSFVKLCKGMEELSIKIPEPPMDILSMEGWSPIGMLRSIHSPIGDFTFEGLSSTARLYKYVNKEGKEPMFTDDIKDVFFKETKQKQIRTTVYLKNGKKGTATCSNDDAFDPFVGILIARANAEHGSKKSMKKWAERKFAKFCKKNEVKKTQIPKILPEGFFPWYGNKGEWNMINTIPRGTDIELMMTTGPNQVGKSGYINWKCDFNPIIAYKPMSKYKSSPKSIPADFTYFDRVNPLCIYKVSRIPKDTMIEVMTTSGTNLYMENSEIDWESSINPIIAYKKLKGEPSNG